MNDQDMYLLFSQQFRLIDDNLDDLVKKAETFLQGSQIIDSWKQSNLNYLLARNKIFSTHENEIIGLVREFRAAQESIKNALAELKRVPTTIGNVTSLIASAVGKGKELQEAV